MVNEQSVEKLLNILGKSKVKQYYGIDIDFTVIECKSVSTSAYNGYDLKLSTEPPLPEVLRVVTTNSWDSDRYANITDLSFVLENQLNYLTSDHNTSIIFVNRPVNTNGKVLNDIANNPNDWYLKQPELFIEMDGNGCFIDKTMGMILAKTFDGGLEYTGDFIGEIDSEEWWDALTPKDKEKLTKAFG